MSFPESNCYERIEAMGLLGLVANPIPGGQWAYGVPAGNMLCDRLIAYKPGTDSVLRITDLHDDTGWRDAGWRKISVTSYNYELVDDPNDDTTGRFTELNSTSLLLPQGDEASIWSALTEFAKTDTKGSHREASMILGEEFRDAVAITKAFQALVGPEEVICPCLRTVQEFGRELGYGYKYSPAELQVMRRCWPGRDSAWPDAPICFALDFETKAGPNPSKLVPGTLPLGLFLHRDYVGLLAGKIPAQAKDKSPQSIIETIRSTRDLEIRLANSEVRRREGEVQKRLAKPGDHDPMTVEIDLM